MRRRPQIPTAHSSLHSTCRTWLKRLAPSTSLDGRPSTYANSRARSAKPSRRKASRSFEVISPCPTLYQRRNKMGDGLDTMKYYKEKSKVKNGAPTSEIGLTLNGEIAVGKFVDRDRPDYQSMMRAQYMESLGELYIEVTGNAEPGMECVCE